MEFSKIKLYRSSTIGLISQNFRLLCDPWLVDGEYYGSWSHYPPFDLEKNLEEINSYDAIYISHIHPDHSSEQTLKKISKKIPIYILSYHSKFLKFKLEKLGFKIFEIENFSEINFKENFSLKIIAADNCNPELCYKFNGCANLLEKKNSQQIDSLAVIKVNGKTILNINDCPYELAKHTLERIKEENNKIDLLLLGYGGAGPYPQCFENLNILEKKEEAKKKMKNFLNQAKSFIDRLNPKYFLPFAGSYILSGHLSSLQDLRGVPNIDFASEYLGKNIVSESKCIRLNTDSFLSLENFTTSKKYEPIEKKEIKKYIDEVLSKKKLSYEEDNEIGTDKLFDLAKKAHIRFINKIKELDIKLESNVLIKVKNKYIFIDNQNQKISLLTESEFKSMNNYVVYDLSSKLLNKILMGPRFAHWNNAEIGSHIKFLRKPDIFERKLYNAINYFHN